MYVIYNKKAYIQVNINCVTSFEYWNYYIDDISLILLTNMINNIINIVKVA